MLGLLDGLHDRVGRAAVWREGKLIVVSSAMTDVGTGVRGGGLETTIILIVLIGKAGTLRSREVIIRSPVRARFDRNGGPSP
jgi:hypothetical protein